MNIKILSPLDGRYGRHTEVLTDYFSEWALMKYRVLIEVEWLIAMSKNQYLAELRKLTEEETAFLRDIVSKFDDNSAEIIKKIEKTTNHDVKAVEYYLKRLMNDSSLADVQEFVHFGCTSEDINNLSYALMLKECVNNVWKPKAEQLVDLVAKAAEELKKVSILSHTHGQAATPTTIGKELAIFVYRWRRQLKQAHALEFLGKFSGVVGNFNAQSIAYPELDWESIARNFVEGFGLVYNPLTTQIESHDYLAECFHLINRFNNITLDFDRDMWMYISLGYFKQLIAEGEVGSSTMPHKVNPINFETSEANLGLSNSILGHLADKLQVSRLQRDLSDSSAQRNIGLGIGYSVVAINYATIGFKQLSVNKEAIAFDLENSWEVLAEPIQTVMRKCGHCKPYEALKELTRGKKVTKETIHQFVADLALPEDDKNRLLSLTPAKYIGIADKLVKNIYTVDV